MRRATARALFKVGLPPPCRSGLGREGGGEGFTGSGGGSQRYPWLLTSSVGDGCGAGLLAGDLPPNNTAYDVLEGCPADDQLLVTVLHVVVGCPGVGSGGALL